MNIAVVGPWLLLATGIVLIGFAIKLGLLGGRTKEMGVSILFGTILSGTSVWGLAFLPALSDALDSQKILSAMIEDPGAETYAAAMESVADGQLSAQHDEAVLAIALQNPIEGMEGILDRSIQTASKPVGKAALQDARRALEDKNQTAEFLARELVSRAEPAGDTLKSIDPALRPLVTRKLLEQPQGELAPLALDPRELRAMGQIKPRARVRTREP